jgi:hypothetical protein
MKTSNKVASACLAIFAACAAGSPARGAAPREIGVGAVLGEPIGASAKLWLTDRTAVDFGAGLSDGNAAFWADMLWHDWTLIPPPKDGKLGAYLGWGPQVRTGDDARFGLRAVVGLSWRPASRPLEFFAEAGPLFRLTQGGAVDGVGGLGLRAFIGGGKKP